MNNFEEYVNSSKIPIIGFPSGEIIYLTKQQLTYFIAREYLIYKKAVDLNGNIIKLEQYCFDDDSSKDIKDIINIIDWS